MIRIYALHARHDAVRDALRDRQLRDLFPLPLAGLRAIHIAGVHRFLEHLFQNEWVPLAPIVEEVTELLTHFVHIEDRAHHRLDLWSIDRFELDDFCASGTSPSLNDRREWMLS